MRYSQFQVLFVGAAVAVAPYGCVPDGPLLPRPTNLHTSPIIANATSYLSRTLDSALNGTLQPGFSVPNTSFSLGIVSLDSPDGLPIWTYHHRGSNNINGSQTLNGDTQYLVGSVSKLITDMLVLRTGIDVEAPVTQYLPLLADESSVIDWKDISLAGLMDHLSGVPPNYGFSEFWFLRDLLQVLGFPNIDAKDVQICGVPGLNTACTKDQLLQGMLTAQPVSSPNNRPVYSQLSFTLLYYALSAVYNDTYAGLLDKYISRPLNLTNTGPSPGNSSHAAIPSIDNSWGSNYVDNAPGGGLFSSLNDLSRLLHSILDRSVLPTEADVRAWLKPHSTTSTPKSLVGRPWEIYRAQNITPEYPHNVDIYAKNGAAQGYAAQVAVIDQYGLGVAVLTAGPPEAWSILYDAILATIVPAAEEEARVQAQTYTGKWIGKDQSGVNVTLELSMDAGPGLQLKGLQRNSSDILGAITQVYTQALPQFGKLKEDLRIYPAELTAHGSATINGSIVRVSKEDWRINLDFTPTGTNTGSQLPGHGLRADECTSWQTADWFYWGGKAVDRVVALKDVSTGKLLGIEIPFLKVVLTKE